MDRWGETLVFLPYFPSSLLKAIVWTICHPACCGSPSEAWDAHTPSNISPKTWQTNRDWSLKFYKDLRRTRLSYGWRNEDKLHNVCVCVCVWRGVCTLNSSYTVCSRWAPPFVVIIQAHKSKIKLDLMFFFLPYRKGISIWLPAPTCSIFPLAFKENSQRQQIHGRHKASYRVPFSRQPHWQDQI